MVIFEHQVAGHAQIKRDAVFPDRLRKPADLREIEFYEKIYMFEHPIRELTPKYYGTVKYSLIFCKLPNKLTD